MIGNLWSLLLLLLFRKRTWQRMQRAIHIQKSRERHGRHTLYGAVSNRLRKPVFHVGPSTNGDDVLEFLRQVKRHLNCRGKPYLVFDGHKAHDGRVVRDYMNAHFRPLQMPPYSCEFNVQERVWRCVKMRYRQQLTEMSASREVTELQFQLLVRQAYQSVSNNVMRRQLNENDLYI